MLSYFLKRKLPTLLIILAAYVFSLWGWESWHLNPYWGLFLFLLFWIVSAAIVLTIENFTNFLRVKRIIREWQKTRQAHATDEA